MTRISTVQRCLNIPEVTQNIVLYADQASRSDVVALSTTCRLFHDAAQDVIWGNLATLADLLKCFPQGVWKCDAYYSNVPVYSRPAAPREWTHFLTNAARVRSFTFTPTPDTNINNEWWSMLAVHRPVLDIFPNIRRLEWHHKGSDALAFAHLFIADKIQSLVLRHYEYDEGFENLMSVINSLIHRRCSLREFRLHLEQDSYIKEVDLAVSDLVRIMDLEIYDSNAPVSSITLDNLIRSHTLKTVKIPTADILSLTCRTTEMFPSVEVLHIYSFDLSHCCKIARDAAPHTLTSLTVTRGQEPTGDSAHMFFLSLSQRMELQKIQALSLLPDDNMYRTLTRQSILQPQVYRLNDALSPLYEISGLTHLHITSCHLEVDDDLIATLTISFPRLQSLLLLPGYYCKRPIKATLNGVRLAVNRFRQLSTLGFPVDTSKEITPPSEQVTRPNNTCSVLDFADSPLPRDKVDSVAAFLASFLGHPHLKIIAYDHQVPASVRYLHELKSLLHRGSWRMVQMAMRPDEANGNASTVARTNA